MLLLKGGSPPKLGFPSFLLNWFVISKRHICFLTADQIYFREEKGITCCYWLSVWMGRTAIGPPLWTVVHTVTFNTQLSWFGVCSVVTNIIPSPVSPLLAWARAECNTIYTTHPPALTQHDAAGTKDQAKPASQAAQGHSHRQLDIVDRLYTLQYVRNRFEKKILDSHIKCVVKWRSVDQSWFKFL